METFSLQSGSNGNCICVEAGNVRLLFDAGISAAQAEQRMASRGRDIRDCDAVIISHEHVDHIRSAGVFQRKFGLPVYATPLTMSANECPLGRLSDVRFFMSGSSLAFADVTVHTVPTPHDARDPLAFIVEHAGRRLGILTDLGHPFALLAELLSTLDAAYLESNYDEEMLATGPYSEQLKRRIRGPHGHLSNDEAAMLACTGRQRRLQWVAAAHLSECNNTSELALNSFRHRVGRYLDVRLAPRDGPTEVWRV